MHPLLWCFISLSLFSSSVRSFTFTPGPPTQCDDLTLSWTGGTAPFQLHLIPVFGTPRNISIPPSAFTNGQGSYSTQLPFAKDQKFILTMSDSTGFGAGGTTQVLVAGPSKGGTCDTAQPTVDFTFMLNSALQQCRPFVFSGYTAAVQPVTIMGIIPGGTSFVLNPPVGPTEYGWNTNVAQETSMIFMMVDSQGRQGGSSDLRIVGNSADKGCLDASSPSSTTARPSSTSTTSPTSSATDSPTPGLSIAAIAGTAIGGFLFLAVLVTLGLFCLRKRQGSKKRSSAVDLTYDPNNSRMYPFSSDNLNSGAITAAPLLPMAGQQAANPFDTPHSTLTPSSNSAYQPAPSEYRSSQNFSSGSQPGFSNAYGHSHSTPSEYGAGAQAAFNPYGYSHSNPSEYGAPTQPAVSNPYGYSHPTGSEYGASPQAGGSNPLGYSRSTGSEYGASPQAGGSNPHGYSRSTGSEYGAGVAAQSTSDNMTPAQRKAMQAGVSSTYTPARFIVHTDVEDVYPPPNEEGVVELPPQYSERRAAQPEPSTSELPYQ